MSKTVCSAQQGSPSQPRRISLMKCSRAVIVVMHGQLARKGERRESSEGAARRTVRGSRSGRFPQMTPAHAFIHQRVAKQGVTCSCVKTVTRTHTGAAASNSRGKALIMLSFFRLEKPEKRAQDGEIGKSQRLANKYVTTWFPVNNLSPADYKRCLLTPSCDTSRVRKMNKAQEQH